MPTASQEHLGNQRKGITFAVDTVTPAEKLIWTETLSDSVSRRLQRKILVLPEERQHVINTIRDSHEKKLAREQNMTRPIPAGPDGRQYGINTVPSRESWLDSLNEKLKTMPSEVIAGLGSRSHPFIDAVHVAFSQHRPLVLSPDVIWLLIAQGFSHHVAENSDLLRPRLVRHRGERELTVEVFDLTLASFEEAIADFSSLIQQEIDPVLHETLICDFSTTRPAMRTASEVALMDTFASYFTYGLFSVCGIPKITLEGTSADWRRIRARIEVIATYGLEWWVSRLRPILDEFVLTAEGHPSLNFWQAIYKPKDAYGDKVATGWLTDLFPYLGDAPGRRRNHVFEHDRHNWALSVEQGVETGNYRLDPLVMKKGVALKSFPSGLSSARIKVRFKKRPGETMELDLVGGFLAVSQDPSNSALSPLISWCATELPPAQPVVSYLQ